MYRFLRLFLVAIIATSVISCVATKSRESTGEFLDSAAITTKIKAKLVDNLGPNGFQIKVKTFKDEVQLSGFVNSNDIKEQAGIIAASVGNVGKVRNDLLVK